MCWAPILVVSRPGLVQRVLATGVWGVWVGDCGAPGSPWA